MLTCTPVPKSASIRPMVVSNGGVDGSANSEYSEYSDVWVNLPPMKGYNGGPSWFDLVCAVRGCKSSR